MAGRGEEQEARHKKARYGTAVAGFGVGRCRVRLRNHQLAGAQPDLEVLVATGSGRPYGAGQRRQPRRRAQPRLNGRLLSNETDASGTYFGAPHWRPLALPLRTAVLGRIPGRHAGLAARTLFVSGG